MVGILFKRKVFDKVMAVLSLSGCVTPERDDATLEDFQVKGAEFAHCQCEAQGSDRREAVLAQRLMFLGLVLGSF